MRSWRVIAGLTALLIASLGLGCSGFFVDPILTGIAVGPAATIQTGTAAPVLAGDAFVRGEKRRRIDLTATS